MTGFVLAVDGMKPLTGEMMLESVDPSPFPANVYRHKHDVEIGPYYMARPVVNADHPDYEGGMLLQQAPEIFPLIQIGCSLDEQWQYFIRACNPGLTGKQVSGVLGDRVAFCNGKGFPGRRNYIERQDLDAELPGFSKLYTCGGSLLQGDAIGSYLLVHTFDGRKPPPRKPHLPGYPTRVEDARMEDYLYNPRETPWMFLTGSLVNDDGSVVPFGDKSVAYAWAPPGRYVFLPYLTKQTEVLYPLDKLVPVDAWVSPYWSAV